MSDQIQPMNPRTTVLVAKDENGRVLGRKAALDPRANEWLTDMARAHKSLTVDYVTDVAFCETAGLFGGWA